ncbi:MAG: DUF2723 domain-containing protein [Chloroflexi bacterium]|nr:DUF2723 domain-containing protein [Chloroflexota bacterium]MCI0580116.1 DUF2723 domain-containing protein [Chloroflexota bacterium]MCI0649308.1 DUF2723 domain-containing protein [Chloroflexota bacterium]MCI0725959.1 DUF2723 domain-containing protein [Chloroflexota bacterium]
MRQIFLGPAVLLVIPALYLLTLARGLVLGDPTEYTFVAYMLGIAHPPGYAFITVVGKLFQSLNPFGDVPWRMHLLSAAAGTGAAFFVYGVVERIGNSFYSKIAALFAALTVATAVNFWQHAIHTNPHIITAAFLAANLFLLTKWWACEQGGREARGQRGNSPLLLSSPAPWLYLFCFSAGLGVTHHPLTVFTFPAYVLFILWVRPGIWREGRTLLKMIALALLGLSLWLYFPIRSHMEPAFGPHDMDTLAGFLNHVLARGLTESLPFFSLADQPGRALVFWTLLRLQYSLPTLFLSVLGLFWLLRKMERGRQGDKETRRGGLLSPSPLLLLYGLAFLGNYAFVISLRQQDIMAYLLGPFLIVGLLAGVGLAGLLELVARRLRPERAILAGLLIPLFLLGPVLQIVRNLPRVSLREYDEGSAYVAAVFDWFEGKNEGAVLLNDWEHMTPLWYSQFVEERWPNPADVQPRLVSTARPWVESVFDFLSGDPVYLSGYRREVVDAGFRLRPRGPFYQVVEQGEATIPPELTRVEAPAGTLEVVGYLLPQRQVTAGDFVPLTLAMGAPAVTADYYAPVLHVGELIFAFTTDSHLITPQWQPGEVIIERFDFALPHDLPAGDYPVTLQLRNLSANQNSGPALALGQLAVNAQQFPIGTDHVLANFRQRVGLVRATASNGLASRRAAPWDSPLAAEPGDVIHLTLEWQSLAPAEQSYTVFVHLIDAANRPLVALDYTPLGGSTPTHLWIPKWLPGQRMLDPYRLPIPADLPPGTYFIEVGLYEMTSGRRLHISDAAGNLAGDRYILGSVVVTE